MTPSQTLFVLAACFAVMSVAVVLSVDSPRRPCIRIADAMPIAGNCR